MGNDEATGLSPWWMIWVAKSVSSSPAKKSYGSPGFFWPIGLTSNLSRLQAVLVRLEIDVGILARGDRRDRDIIVVVTVDEDLRAAFGQPPHERLVNRPPLVDSVEPVA